MSKYTVWPSHLKARPSNMFDYPTLAEAMAHLGAENHSEAVYSEELADRAAEGIDYIEVKVDGRFVGTIKYDESA